MPVLGRTGVQVLGESDAGAGLVSPTRQQESEPTKFVHRFEFADGEAHQAHGASAAVRRFEQAYQPELAAGPVVFTDYLQIASNQSH